MATQTTALIGFRTSATSIDGFVFTKNKIHDLKTTSTGLVSGINIAGLANTPFVGVLVHLGFQIRDERTKAKNPY
jgi:hypothetical protein